MGNGWEVFHYNNTHQKERWQCQLVGKRASIGLVRSFADHQSFNQPALADLSLVPSLTPFNIWLPPQSIPLDRPTHLPFPSGWYYLFSTIPQNSLMDG
jgi:hypothetical protein